LEHFLLSIFLGKAVWLWLSFLSIIFVLMFIDLGILHRRNREIGVRESFMLTGFYISISLLFGLFVWHQLGSDLALEYYTGYVIEKSLSIDNIFVMAVIFGALHIPRRFQHRVLFWGILGVIVMRGTMIGLGAALIHEFEWILYIFAAFLMFTGVKLLFLKDGGDHEKAVENNPIVQFLRKHLHVTDRLHEQRFFVREISTRTGKLVLHATPLLLALVTIELADVVFAVDSVPAIFAITQDTFIVFTSNVFAILGLRAVFFALSAMLERFAYLKYALALVLIFIGSKVFIVDMFNLAKFPAAVSLSVTLGLLIGGVLYSLHKTKRV
jgi:tellurite resistance protein TerC